MLALGTLWTWTNLHGATGRMPEVRPFAADRGTTAIVEIVSGGKDRLSVDVVLRLVGTRGEQVVAHSAVVERAGTGRTPCELPALPRGVHGIRGAFLRSKHPFGLWWRHARIDAPAELIVHPAPLDETRVAGRTAEGADLPELHGSQSFDAPAGLREWTVGDALHAIDWRATARRTRPIVKELEREAGRGISVCFDRRCPAATFERCLSALVTLCRHATETDQPLHLTTQGMCATFGDGHRSRDQLLRWLAEAEPLPRHAEPLPPATPDAIRLPSRAVVTTGGAA